MATAMMARATTGSGATFRARKPAEGGFSLIEVMVSMVVLTVGLVSLAGVFGLAMAATETSQQDMIAKQLANESVESLVTARNTSQLAWDDIRNVNGTGTDPTAGGVFLDGPQPIYLAGADGIFGTADDSAAGAQFLTEPGPDGIYGTADDVQVPLTDYTRTIVISQVRDSTGNLVSTLRAVTVTVQYETVRVKLPKTYVLSTLISQYR